LLRWLSLRCAILRTRDTDRQLRHKDELFARISRDKQEKGAYTALEFILDNPIGRLWISAAGGIGQVVVQLAPAERSKCILQLLCPRTLLRAFLNQLFGKSLKRETARNDGEATQEQTRLLKNSKKQTDGQSTLLTKMNYIPHFRMSAQTRVARRRPSAPTQTASHPRAHCS
jgi:hypothetical protein